MRAKDLLPVAFLRPVILIAILLAYLWWHPWTAVNGGPEDPAIRAVELRSLSVIHLAP